MNSSYLPVQSALAAQLGDARRQLHHAAQFATALGISFLPHAADDSHTNLEWSPAHRALMSQAAQTSGGAIRVGVCIPDLKLLVMRDDAVAATFNLRGQTIDSGANWLRQQLDASGLEGSQYSLVRHYEIPAHAVSSGAEFSANPQHLEELAHWFGNAALQLDSVRAENNGEHVRCWPHHFDIATLITVRDGASVGVGLEPGDGYYDEPYFYVNAHPQPKRESLTTSLDGGGNWHTHEWIGAVLPASSVSADASAQEDQMRAFLSSAIRACRSLIA